MNIEHAKDEACLQLGSYTSFVELREACENNHTSLSNLIYHMEHAMEIYASQTENKPDAVDFAEWLGANCVETKQDGEDEIYAKGSNLFYIDNSGIKTEMTLTELYAKFKSPKK